MESDRKREIKMRETETRLEIGSQPDRQIVNNKDKDKDRLIDL